MPAHAHQSVAELVDLGGPVHLDRSRQAGSAAELGGVDRRRPEPCLQRAVDLGGDVGEVLVQVLQQVLEPGRRQVCEGPAYLPAVAGQIERLGPVAAHAAADRPAMSAAMMSAKPRQVFPERSSRSCPEGLRL